MLPIPLHFIWATPNRGFPHSQLRTYDYHRQANTSIMETVCCVWGCYCCVCDFNKAFSNREIIYLEAQNKSISTYECPEYLHDGHIAKYNSIYEVGHIGQLKLGF